MAPDRQALVSHVVILFMLLHVYIKFCGIIYANIYSHHIFLSKCFQNTLSLTVEHNDPSSTSNGLNIDTVKVFGVRTKPSIFYIGDKAHTSLQYDETAKVS